MTCETCHKGVHSKCDRRDCSCSCNIENVLRDENRSLREDRDSWIQKTISIRKDNKRLKTLLDKSMTPNFREHVFVTERKVEELETENKQKSEALRRIAHAPRGLTDANYTEVVNEIIGIADQALKISSGEK